MAKKSSKSLLSNLYLIGMALVAVGFIVPIFRGNLVKVNGFDLVGDGNSIMKIAALLVFIGAVAGIVLSFVNAGKNQSLLKVIALAASVAGGLYVFFNTSNFGVQLASKYLSVGFYLIVIGWVAAIVGYLQKK
ncbi:MAG: hypothetical protein IJR50_06385 [Treponema sp.]|nr:hypothetical protein [Treponema sp.]